MALSPVTVSVDCPRGCTVCPCGGRCHDDGSPCSFSCLDHHVCCRGTGRVVLTVQYVDPEEGR